MFAKAVAIGVLLFAATMPPGAGQAQTQMPMPPAAAGADAGAVTGTLLGEVRLIDRDSNKITVAHQPIAEFNMRAMTMVLQAPGPALIADLKVGDRIKAVVVRNGGAFTIQTVEVEK